MVKSQLREVEQFLGQATSTSKLLLCSMTTLMYILIIQLEGNRILQEASNKIEIKKNQTMKTRLKTNFCKIV